MSGERVSAVAVASDATDDTVTAKKFYGWSLHESAGTPAVASVLFKDTDSSGSLLGALELAADTSDTVFFPDGVVVPSGTLYIDKTAGSTEGAVYISG